LRFTNESWNDTVSSVKWNFNVGSQSITDSINLSAHGFQDQSFAQSGWVNIAMTAYGNHTAPNTRIFDSCVFVADATARPGNTVLEEFNPSADLAKWPTFNYYNNEFKWQTYDSAGYDDNFCMKYDGYDARIIPGFGITPTTGGPFGDFDDFFSIPVDLSSMATGACNLNFWTSGASRTSNSYDINDSLKIYYSTDQGVQCQLPTYRHQPPTGRPKRLIFLL